MIEREWIIKAIEYFTSKVSSQLCTTVWVAKLDKDNKQIRFGMKMIANDGSILETTYNDRIFDLEEFIKDCQEKVPVLFEIRDKYDKHYLGAISAELKFLIETVETAKKLKKEALNV